MSAETSPLEDLQASIAYNFTNIEWLEEALTHPSFHIQGTKKFHNQRLEFLGDSILGSVLASWLFEKFPTDNEGDLSKKKALLARGSHLSKIAKSIRLDRYLRAANSERNSQNEYRESLLEDALEALLGAVLMDGGYAESRRIILNWTPIFEQTLTLSISSFNPKGQLQELIQSFGGNLKIKYNVVSSSGPDHRKTFNIEVCCDGRVLARAKGASKKEAEERAAKLAFIKMRENPEIITGFREKNRTS